MFHYYMFNYMFNKPAGYLTARTDAVRPTIMTFFPPEMRDVLHPVGRLDRDTVGLLLLTDDGFLDPYLLPPEVHMEKTYSFKAFGSLTDEDAVRIAAGIALYGNEIPARPARLEILGRSTVADNVDFLPEARKRRYLRNPVTPVTSGCITISEGKKHEVKLILKAVGCHVFFLKRLSIGPLQLDESLPEGQYRELTASERDALFGGYPGPYEALEAKGMLPAQRRL